MGERLASGDAWEALEHWAKAKGMTWSSWKVGEVNGIRGAVSTRSIKAGQVLVRAPRESVLLVTQKQPSPLPPEFIDAAYWEEMSGYWNIRMALLLLYEKRLGAASSWQAYLDVLPASFSTPLTWRDEELAHLQFVPFIDELRVERSYFAYEAQRMRQYMPSPVSQEEMFWALSCVGSRTFTALMGGDAAYDGTAMCPIADMVNHNDASAPAFRWDEEDQAFELFAPADVGEGEEVCISYGQVNNAHLLHFYGFIPGANCHDSLPVTEEEVQTAARQLDARDGVVSEALEALRRGVLQYLVDPGGSVPGLSLPLKKLSDTWRKDSEETATDAYLTRIPGHAFNIGGGGAICLEFVLYCRLWALREEDTKRSAGTWVLDELSIAKLLQGGRDVSPQHAARSRELMLRALGNQLASMPTSYEDDAAIAARIQQGSPPEGWHGSTDNLMLALRYRMAHKSLLLDALASLS